MIKKLVLQRFGLQPNTKLLPLTTESEGMIRNFSKSKVLRALPARLKLR